MPRTLRPLDASGTATAIDHLEELRWRLFATIAWFVACLGAALAWNDQLFTLLNQPLGDRFTVTTLGVTEPFFTSLTVAANAAFVATFPVIAYNGWRFVSPALDLPKRRAVRRLALAAPLLFLAGVAFCYEFVLAAAIRFLLGIGADNFNVTVRAADYYSFVSMTMLAMGIVFLFPLLLLALAHAGIVTSTMLRANRRIALVLVAIMAALLPTADPVSLAVEMLPMIALFELGVLLVRLHERSVSRSAATGHPSA